MRPDQPAAPATSQPAAPATNQPVAPEADQPATAGTDQPAAPETVRPGVPDDVIGELLDRNRRAAMSHPYWIGPVPTMHVAMVMCMDTRIDTYRAFRLDAGEVHMLRNAGGVVTDDMIRSLAISQHALGTRDVMVVHHTDCGLARLEEDAFRAQLARFAGFRPTWAVQAFKDPHESVRESLLRLRSSPFLLDTAHIRGFVFDVKTGLLEEVFAEQPVHDDRGAGEPADPDRPAPGDRS